MVPRKICLLFRSDWLSGLLLARITTSQGLIRFFVRHGPRCRIEAFLKRVTTCGRSHALFHTWSFCDERSLVGASILFLGLRGAYRHTIAIRVEHRTRSQSCRRRDRTRILLRLPCCTETWFRCWSQHERTLFHSRCLRYRWIYFYLIYLLFRALGLLRLLDPVLVLRTFLDYLFIELLRWRPARTFIWLRISLRYSIFGIRRPFQRLLLLCTTFWRGPRRLFADSGCIRQRNLPQHDVVYLYRWDARAVLEAWWRLLGALTSTIYFSMISRYLVRRLLYYRHHEVVLWARVPRDLLNLNWLFFARFQNTSFPWILTRCWWNGFCLCGFGQRVIWLRKGRACYVGFSSLSSVLWSGISDCPCGLRRLILCQHGFWAPQVLLVFHW